MPRITTLRDLVIQADPDWPYARNHVVEYEVSASPGRRGWRNDLTHEDGKRVFRGYEPNRGAYADD